MKHFTTGELTDVTFALTKQEATSYKLILEKVVGDEVLEYENLIPIDSDPVSKHYHSSAYYPAFYSTETTGGVGDCVKYIRLQVTLPLETLGGDYKLTIEDQDMVGSQFFLGLAEVKSDYGIDDVGGATTDVDNSDVYSNSKVI